MRGGDRVIYHGSIRGKVVRRYKSETFVENPAWVIELDIPIENESNHWTWYMDDENNHSYPKEKFVIELEKHLKKV